MLRGRRSAQLDGAGLHALAAATAAHGVGLRHSGVKTAPSVRAVPYGERALWLATLVPVARAGQALGDVVGENLDRVGVRRLVDVDRGVAANGVPGQSNPARPQAVYDNGAPNRAVLEIAEGRAMESGEDPRLGH